MLPAITRIPTKGFLFVTKNRLSTISFHVINMNLIVNNWCVAELRRLGSIYGNAELAARITYTHLYHVRF